MEDVVEKGSEAVVNDAVITDVDEDVVELDRYLDEFQESVLLLVEQRISEALGKINGQVGKGKKSSILETENAELRAKLTELEQKYHRETVGRSLDSVVYDNGLIPEIAIPYLEKRIKANDDGSIVVVDGDVDVELTKYVESLVKTDIGRAMVKPGTRGISVTRSANSNSGTDVSAMLTKAFLAR